MIQRVNNTYGRYYHHRIVIIQTYCSEKKLANSLAFLHFFLFVILVNFQKLYYDCFPSRFPTVWYRKQYAMARVHPRRMHSVLARRSAFWENNVHVLARECVFFNTLFLSSHIFVSLFLSLLLTSFPFTSTSQIKQFTSPRAWLV